MQSEDDLSQLSINMREISGQRFLSGGITDSIEPGIVANATSPSDRTNTSIPLTTRISNAKA